MTPSDTRMDTVRGMWPPTHSPFNITPLRHSRFRAASTLRLPTFNDPADQVALETLARLMPRRRVVGIHAVDLVWGLGTLHCLTQQQPAARR